ncbi:MAG TPA: ion transporter [Candidatus Gracilibacteria bacterium]
MNRFRKTCFYCLHTPYTRTSKIINGFIAFLIIVSLAVIPIYILSGLGWFEEYKGFLDWIEKFTITVFSIEYVLRVYSAPKPLHYMFSWWGLIDLVAILPFYLSRVIPIAHPEVWMMLRFLRILKLAKINEIDHARLSHDCKDTGHGHFIPLGHEHLEKVVQKHPLVFMLSVSLPLALTSMGLATLFIAKSNPMGIAIGILLLAFAIVFFAKAWLDHMYDVIYITDKRVMIQNRKLFGITSNDISYESMTNIIPDNSGLLQWLIGFGNIEIQTAAGISPVFQNAPKPDHVVRRIVTNREQALEKVSQSDNINPQEITKTKW